MARGVTFQANDRTELAKRRAFVTELPHKPTILDAEFVLEQNE